MKFFALIFLFTFPMLLSAQTNSDAVKGAINEALAEHIVKVYPQKSCEYNDCAHSYTKGLKITKHQEVQGTLRTWGLAKVTYRNARIGGNDVIEFYAELKKEAGIPVVTKLRWRKGDCMKFETVYSQ
jgi:hypothetical protein